MSRGYILYRRRFTRRDSGSEEWGMSEVNSTLNAVAISWLRVRVFLLKVIGCLGKVWIRLPERDLRREKYCEVLYL